MKLRFTSRAATELDEILASIEEHSPQGALNVKKRLQMVIALLLRYPQSGPMTNTRGLRRVVVYPYPYLVYYRATDAEVIIHGVRHTARRQISKPK